LLGDRFQRALRAIALAEPLVEKRAFSSSGRYTNGIASIARDIGLSGVELKRLSPKWKIARLFF
jgi:hypothetical protein